MKHPALYPWLNYDLTNFPHLTLADYYQDLCAELNARQSLIEQALAQTVGGTHTFNDVIMQVMQGKYAFWPIPESKQLSYFIMEILNYPRQKHLHLFLVGGNMQELIAMLPEVEAFGRQAECNALTAAGRPGWLRVLKSHGWNHAFSAVAKSLETTDGQGLEKLDADDPIPQIH